MKKKERYILWFEEISKEDVLLVGGKNASLGEMFSKLSKKGVKIPNGFAITAKAFRDYLKFNKIDEKLKEIFEKFKPNSIKSLKETGKAARQLILKGNFPPDLEREILKNYQKLSKIYSQKNVDVAVRSSATAEDLASIAGNEMVLVKVGNETKYIEVEKLFYELQKTPKPLFVPSLDKNGKIKWMKIKEFYQHPSTEATLYKIITKSGREITITPDHSLITLDPNTLEWKVSSIKELNSETRIPVLKKLPLVGNSPKAIDVKHYIKSKPTIIHKGRVKIAHKNTLDQQEGLPLKIKVDKKFAYFLGIFLAEGSVYEKENCIDVSNDSKKVLKKVKNFYQSIGLRKSKILKRGIRIHNSALAAFLLDIVGKPLAFKGKGRFTKIKSIPNFMFSQSREIICEFLKGLFDGDGWVSGIEIKYSSLSRELIGGMGKLLEMLGIKCYFGKSGTEISIPVTEAEKFKRMINFTGEKNQKKLNELIKIYKQKEKHQDFIETFPPSRKISELLEKYLKPQIKLKKIKVTLCPKCSKPARKFGTYKDYRNKNIKIQRYFCKNCQFYFSERSGVPLKTKIISKYVNYDEFGRFKKDSVPWNKGNRKYLITYGFSHLKKIAEKIRSKELLKILDSDVIWDKIEKIEPIKYFGHVYDFVVSKTQNFAAGLGGIITHNTASFAGQHESYINVSGPQNLLKAVKKCFASLFTDRAIAYREEKGFNHLEIALSVCVQKMVRSDLASSGVMFTLDTETGFENVVLINSIFGQGEMIVKGKIIPDTFYVFKPTLKQGYKAIIRKDLGKKDRKLVYKKGGGLKEVKVPKKDQLKFSLTDQEILTLAKWAMILQEHYGMHQDIEWAKDGKTNQLFIVQSRPETVHAPQKEKVYEEYEIKTTKKPILTGIAIGNKVGQGRVHVIEDVSRIGEFQKGEVLVTRMTDPDWVPIMRIASAIVTDEGGRTCFSGDTKILTDKGFFSLEEIFNRFKNEEIKTLSLNYKTLKLEWKKISNVFLRESSNLMKIEISQTGRMKENFLKVTSDHKFLTFKNRRLISEEIEKIISQKEYILSAFQIPLLKEVKFPPQLGYLLGALMTDGNIYINERHGRVSFIQKPSAEKLQLIKTVFKCFSEIFKYDLHTTKKSPSEGIIRGRKIKGGESLALNCYKKDIAKGILQKIEKIEEILLSGQEDFLFNFLAGVIDGDGTFFEKRIQIFCSDEKLLHAISICCLRLGINFQVSKNRTIYNVLIVDKVNEILRFTKRVKGEEEKIKFGSRFFAAKQLLEDIINLVNYKGRVLLYVKNNLLIDAEKIRNYVIPLLKGAKENHELTKIINSPLKMLRVKGEKIVGKEKVYNIEVEDNHNYLVFTNRLTPVLVENCHAAIIGRELGIPAIVGTGSATKVLKTGQEVTVDCTSGSVGRIFLGKIPFKVKRYNLEKIPRLKTKIMINIGAPEIAFKASFLPNDGVGLARIEFILAEKIRVHPLALYYFEKLKQKTKKDKKIKEIVKKIEEITIEHKDKREHFYKELAEGVAQIAAAFWPKPVIVRFSDFKSNEYRQLIGGELFEPEESNPMLGWRGASRYYDPKFQPAFEMECKAIKRAREEFGLKNIWVMIPFCRTIEEGEKVLDLMKKFGLEKGKDGLKVICMCEIPSNVILAEDFLKIFDGFSIGSNDLTQLVLGLDRDSAIVAKVGDERNEAVKEMIKKIIKLCNQKKKYCGICGDIPSTDINFAKFLIKHNIPSISLSPDAVMKTIINLSKN
jgi:pyruvate,water dikinase